MCISFRHLVLVRNDKRNNHTVHGINIQDDYSHYYRATIRSQIHIKSDKQPHLFDTKVPCNQIFFDSGLYGLLHRSYLKSHE